ncbi:T9SS type B sorting domain-containing protein [uncultured Algibacter sp.]|uniref:T9SS type B sorting domain-containing protein n=1 Tax=uncultured Algibacter sp. TaxID=298659 RepID=UPI002604871B|nr:T9SS type B sorting domain-containing protein [uncultured Algibacter sp.]
MKKIFLLTLSFVCFNNYAQNEATNWYFGYGSGIRFNLTNNTVSALTDGKLNTTEGCATISDGLGNLVFYTDGITVWNKDHDVMPNGRNLFGDPSSTQSAIIVPKPNSDSIYYIFTVDDHGFNLPHFGLNYSVVDTSLNDGLGEVTSKNVNLLKQCSEKITAVLKNCITGSIWVLGLASENGKLDIYNTFHAFEVSDSGVNQFSVKSPFDIEIIDERGYLKLSPDGTKMACANATSGLFLYDFDANTGTISNQIELYLNDPAGVAYGVEFSPNNQLLYVSSSNDFLDQENLQNNENEENHKSLLTQFNLSATNIETSAITIDSRQLFRGALQLGPNGKIYRALSKTYTKGINSLGVINNPNELGLNCNYRHNSISLGASQSSQGLPPFISSFFNTKIDIIKNGKSTTNLGVCDGGSYTLSADEISGATYIWTRDKVVLAETSRKLELSGSDSGYYEVYIDPNNGDCALEGEAFVSFNKNPEAINETLFQCDEDVDGLTTFNLKESIKAITNNTSRRTVEFFLNASRTAKIENYIFNNTRNPQTIFTKVIDDNTGCFSLSEITLEVSVTDSVDTELTICDDDGIEDGLHIFNLNDAKNKIINSSSNLTISYYKTYNDALIEQNELSTLYTNSIPYSQTIYARVENNNQCYGINTIELIVNPLPEIGEDEVLYYCLNKFPEKIKLYAGILKQTSSNYKYNWSTGESTSEIHVNSTGTFTVSVVNNFGCIKTKTIVVEAANVASFESINVTDATENNTITVITSGEGVYQYQLLDNNNMVTTSFQDENTFSNVFPGIYTVSVRDIKNNCGEVNDIVSVIGFPKFFTPNNDGRHDTWQVYGVSQMFQPNTKVQIFNRFGKLIKELTPLGEGWNGILNGVKLPSDDYWFSVKLQDGRVYRNHFALIN